MQKLTGAGLFLAAYMGTMGGVAADSQIAQAGKFDAKAYFEGKTIEMIIPLRAGGTLDLVGRYFAAELPKFFPGNPRILARNITPRIAGANFISKSKSDGLTMGLVSTVLYQDQYHSSASFDVAKFKYIGATNSVEGAWFVRGELPYDSVEQAKGGKVPIRVAVMPDATSMTGFDFAPLLIAEALKLPLQAIPVSDTGLGAQLKMLEREEIDGINRGIVYYQVPRIRPGWLSKGTVKPFAFIGLPGTKMWPAKETDKVVANVTDMITDPTLREAWDATIMSSLALWAPFFLPPETPDHIVEVWRGAFDKAMADPAFREGYEKIDGIEARPVKGAAAQALVEKYADASRKYHPKYEALVTSLYQKYTDAYKNRQ